MNELFLALMAVAALVLTTGFLSITIERIPILSRPIITLLMGCLLGPFVLNWLNPHRWSENPEKILEFAAELTMAIALMGVALRLEPKYFLKNKRSMALILGAGMPLMWMSSTLIIMLILDLPFLAALLIGAIITPTDPVLSTTIVHGKIASENIPERVRHFISAEAGANDGLALPFVYLPMLIVMKGSSQGFSEWISSALLQETFGGILLGIVVGFATGRLLRAAEKSKAMESSSLLATTLALTLLVLGLSEYIQVNGILAVFVSGIAFDNAVSAGDRAKEEKIQEATNQFFTAPIFFLFGLYLPWDEWLQLGWKALALIIAIMLFRRLPGVMLIGGKIPALKNRGELMLAGWFGPIGAAAIYYALEVKSKTHLHAVWVIASLVVFSSVIIHGMTGTPLSKLLKHKEE